MKNWSTKRIRHGLGSLLVPLNTAISGVIEGARLGDEVGTVVRIRMHVEIDEFFIRNGFRPCVSFVAGLPHRIVVKTDEKSLKTARLLEQFRS